MTPPMSFHRYGHRATGGISPVPALPRRSRVRLAIGAAALVLPAALAGNAVAADVAPGELQPLAVDARPASASYTLVNTWGIDKWAAPRAGWDKKDQSVAVDYTVKVTRRAKPTRIQATGTVVVTNPNPTTAFTYSVADELPGAECEVVQAPSPDPAVAGQAIPQVPVIPAGGTHVWIWGCSLEALPKDVVYGTVTVRFGPQLAGPVPAATPDTAALGVIPVTPLPGSASMTVPVDFANAPRTVVNPAVTVTDTLDGDQTRLLQDVLEEGRTFRYRRYLSFWRVKKICRTWDNVAKITPAPLPVEPVASPVVAQESSDLVVADWAKTATASVKVCPPPPPEKKGDDVPPPKVEVTGPGSTTTDPVAVKPADNPKDPVVKDNRSRGRLLVTKSADRPRAAVGDRITWRIAVRNTGTAELYGVKLVDVLPKQLVRVTAEAAGGGTVIGNLAPGEQHVVTLTTRVAGRPAPTPAALATARRIAVAQDRDAAMRRLRRGIVCNVARATARKAVSDSDTACVRIVRGPRATG